MPKYILIDNGKDYTKKELTGVNRKQRVRTDFDDEVKGFYQPSGSWHMNGQSHMKPGTKAK